MKEPFVQVATAERVSFYRVVEAFDAHACDELAESPQWFPRVVNLDESAFRRMFRYHTVFSDPERGAVLDLVEGRGKGAVFGVLLAMSDQIRAGIETVVIDCHWPYHRALEEVLPDARIVVDKFHIIRAVDAAAQRVRMRVGRRRYRQRIGHQGVASPVGTTLRINPMVYQARWVFMRRSFKLTDEQRAWLEAVLDGSVS